jgi:hypothetical protein
VRQARGVGCKRLAHSVRWGTRGVGGVRGGDRAVGCEHCEHVSRSRPRFVMSIIALAPLRADPEVWGGRAGRYSCASRPREDAGICACCAFHQGSPLFDFGFHYSDMDRGASCDQLSEAIDTILLNRRHRIKAC